MRKAKYKVGEFVNVQHIGACKVKHIFTDGVGRVYYVLEYGTNIFSVTESAITGKKGE